MLHILLIFLAMLPNTYCVSAFVNKVVPLKHPQAYPIIFTVSLHTIWLLNNFILPTHLVFLDLLVFVVALAILLCFTVKGQRFRALLTQVLLLLVSQLLVLYPLAAISTAICSDLGIPPERLTDIHDSLYILMCLINSLCCCGAMYGCVVILRIVLSPVTEFKGILWFLSIPLSQLVLINLALHLIVDPTEFHDITGAIVAGILLAILADVSCVIGYRKLHQMQQLRMQVQQAEHQLNTQISYYRDLQEQILRVNQIRHDLNNQLQSAYYLMDHGHPTQVRQQLDLLWSSIRDKVGTKYCENLMVDAVLTEKAQQCASHSITLDVSISLPAQLNIENAHLCSAFSNLLDNSIHGTLEKGDPAGTIYLRSDIQKNCLAIRCTNPAVRPKKQTSKDSLRLHGLGLDILDRLAKLYDGYQKTDFQDGQFTTTLILNIPEKIPEA